MGVGLDSAMASPGNLSLSPCGHAIFWRKDFDPPTAVGEAWQGRSMGKTPLPQKDVSGGTANESPGLVRPLTEREGISAATAVQKKRAMVMAARSDSRIK